MLMTVLEKLGYNIRVVRKRKGLTQQQLADQSHISLKHLQLIEKGVKNPSFEILRSLTGVLGLSIDALLNSSDGEINLRMKCVSSTFPVHLKPEKHY